MVIISEHRMRISKTDNYYLFFIITTIYRLIRCQIDRQIVIAFHLDYFTNRKRGGLLPLPILKFKIIIHLLKFRPPNFSFHTIK